MVELKPNTTGADMTVATGNTNDTTMIRRQVENPNRRIQDYHLLRVIGTGTFGKVYLALLNG